jgi:hypothetical protein
MTMAIGQPSVNQMFSSAARGTTTSDIQAVMDNNAVVLQLVVTAQSGTNPTLDLVVHTDSGPWSTFNTFTQITGATANVVMAPSRKPMPFLRAVGTVGGTSTPLFTYTLFAVMYKTTSLAISTTSSGTAGLTGLTVTSADAAAATVGLNGATNPALQVDASTGSSATGLKIKSAAAASGVALSVISSGTNENLTIDAKGSGTISLNVTGTGNIVLGRAATGVSLAVTAGITSSGPTGAGIGYATGAGGTVTQATDRSTGVTLSKLCGTITTNAASLAAGAEATFTVTNTTVAATDTVVLSIKSGGTTSGSTWAAVTAVGAGSFDITVTNLHASTADTAALVLNFSVIKAVAA